jgi:hypothetical protein
MRFFDFVVRAHFLNIPCQQSQIIHHQPHFVMDLYNRYFMRASGEDKHQPQSAEEASVFAILDLLDSGKQISGWDSMTEIQRDALMQEMRTRIALCHQNWPSFSRRR